MAGTSHVLARKYRPQVFADLIGQDALVRTITNAIEHNRLAHAYMLTGIRGVGKTSSARIIAKGLNCVGIDGTGGMTPNPCGKCKHCLDIASDSHIDVIEIDAASNTGVDNIREIIEGAKYNPVSARFKIYIIDEVHMLSKQAFNALLKTLEEPPERIKFIFATTEIRKVPITILSRCQRFDLKRLDESILGQHLGDICTQENVKAEEEALRLIARAGDGSCRDSLSLLDQAMTQFDGNITAQDVRQMLGLADRTGLLDLYEALMKGDMPQTLAFLDKQYELGADPLVVTQDLLNLTHWLTRVKVLPDLAQDITLPEAERVRGTALAATLSMASLTSAWQLLLRGIAEVKQADNPIIALEMLLIRFAFLAELPPLTQVIADIKKNGLALPTNNVNTASTPPALQTPAGAIPATTAATSTQPSGVVNTQENTNSSTPLPIGTTATNTNSTGISTLKDISNLAKSHGDRLLAYNIETYVRPISIEPGVLTCSLTADTPRSFGSDLARFLKDKTGLNWEIRYQATATTQTLKEKEAQKHDLLLAQLQQTPIVKSVTEAFPGTKIGRVKAVQTETEKEDTPDSDSLIPPEE